MNIDVTKIEGFEDMTDAEKVKALTEYEIETPKDNTAELDKLKKQMSKANGEVAEYKRQLKAKMSEDEKAQSEREEKEKAMLDELNALRKEKVVKGYENQYLALGYEPELATATATAMANGNMDEVFKNQKTFLEGQTAKIKAEAMKGQPSLSEGGGLSKKDMEKAEIDKMRSYFGL